jgi:hypothetical protein
MAGRYDPTQDLGKARDRYFRALVKQTPNLDEARADYIRILDERYGPEE